MRATMTMMILSYAAVAAVMLLTPGASAINSYVVIGPKIVRPGMTYQMTVSILDNVRSDVQLVAEIRRYSEEEDSYQGGPGGRPLERIPLIPEPVELDGSGSTVSTTPSTTTTTMGPEGEMVSSNRGIYSPGRPGTLSIRLPLNLTPGNYRLKVRGIADRLEFTNETRLEFNSKRMSIFVQTDKATYKPSDKVQFRVVAVDPYLKPYKGKLEVQINDPSGNRIKIWRDLSTDIGVVTLDFMLSDQPIFGAWTINVNVADEREEKGFVVEEYVLPRFEVKVNLPAFLVGNSFKLTGTVEAKYTHGGKVKGKATVYLKELGYYGSSDLNALASKTVEIDGEADFSFNFHFIHGDRRKLTIEATVLEELTGVKLNGSASVVKYNHPVRMKFEGPQYYKSGLEYVTLLLFSRQDGSPLFESDSKVVEIEQAWQTENPDSDPEWRSWDARRRIRNTTTTNYTIPADGRVVIETELPPKTLSLQLRAKYTQSGGDSQYEYHNANEYMAAAGAYLQVSLVSRDLMAGDTARFILESTEDITGFSYQVVARGNIDTSGYMEVNGDIKDFEVTVTSAMAPSSRMIVYYVHSSGEVIIDAVNFQVKGGFENEVSLSFDKKKAEPGNKVNLRINTAPDSFVGVLAVDQKVQLLRGGNDITKGQVLKDIRSYGFSQNDYDDGPIWFNPGGPVVMDRKKRSILWYPWHWYSSGNAWETFEEAKLAVLTDTFIYGGKRRPYSTARSGGGRGGGGSGGGGGGLLFDSHQGAPVAPGTSPSVKPEPVRKDFPETWLWINSSAGADGIASIHTNVPDTITSWVASAFAMHETQGLGVAEESAKITVSRPFFAQLDLPYSVVRGEEVYIRVLIFNYLDRDVDVVTTLENDGGKFDNVRSRGGATGNQVKTTKVKSGGPSAVYFGVKPKMLGEIPLKVTAQTNIAADALKKNLRVKAEGVTRFFNKPFFLNLGSERNSTVTNSFNVPWPRGPAIVADSQRLEISAVGDVMGPTIKNIDGLVRMPYGCGEQNMLNFAPNIYVSDYLQAVNEYTPDTEAKTERYMEAGYQRELTYQREDGSFSAFGNSDKYGSMWLTAFVAKCFHQAKPYIYIDPALLGKAVNWMVNHMQQNGSFLEVGGEVHHKAMQGGSSEGIALSAYTVIALLEISKDIDSAEMDDTDVEKAEFKMALDTSIQYLVSRVSAMDTPYELALTNYALTLANHPAQTDTRKKLEKLAKEEDGMKYWKNAEEQPKSADWWYYHSHPSVDIEMTSYVLLSHTYRKDIEGALPIMKWLVSQRNELGGFSSTQDTVIGLQALAEWGELSESGGKRMQIDVTAGQKSHRFTINDRNADTLQSWVVGSKERGVRYTASGRGTGLLQITYQYNELQDLLPPAFNTSAKAWKNADNSIDLEVCTRYMKAGESGMSVVEVKFPSGIKADETGLKELEKLTDLQRAETADEGNTVNLYYNKFEENMDKCATVRGQRLYQVANLKPTPVRTYAYYQPEEQAVALYQVSNLEVEVPGIDDDDDQAGNEVAHPEPHHTTPPPGRKVYRKQKPDNGQQALSASVLLTCACLLLRMLHK